MGFLVTLAGMFMLYVMKFMPQNVSISEAIYLLKVNKNNVPKVLSLSLLANIPLITYFKNRYRYKTLKGIFIIIILIEIIAVLYKLNAF